MAGSQPSFIVISGDLNDLLRFRSSLLRELVTAGNRVIIVTPDTDSSLLRDVMELGAEHHRIRLNRTGTNPFQDVRTVLELYKCLRPIKPTAIFAEGAKPIVVGITAAYLIGAKRRYAMLPGLGYAFTDSGKKSVRRSVVRFSQALAYRALLSRCRAVIFHNEDDMLLIRRLAGLGEHKTWVVPGSGIDLDTFSASEAPSDPVRFLFLGRLLRSKGVTELLEAAKLLRAECPTAEVHLAGAMDMNPESIDGNVLRHYEARGDVVLHGRVADVRPLLREASVLVLPSYREGLPRSALEALASGRTLIVTDVPGCREVVSAGTYGELVPPRDSQSLAQAMIRYARDPQRIVHEGRAARRAAEERFDVRDVTTSMLRALEVPDGRSTLSKPPNA